MVTRPGHRNGSTFTAPAGTAWAAQSAADWITITGNASGTGPGTVTYTVSRNSSAEEREGQIRVTTAGEEQSSLEQGLIAYYPFNGNADDESGNGNNGIDLLPVFGPLEVRGSELFYHR